MKNEKISVIIPNYNKEKYIRDCLDSVLSQTYPNIEIIVVDDRSSDSSPDIIEEYAAKYSNILPVLLKKNQGVSHARNTGIKKSSGKYVTMLDSDDYYYNPKKLENEMNLLKRYHGNGIAYSYRQMVDENNQLLFEERRQLDRYISGDVFYRFMTEKDACEFVQRDYLLPKKYLIEAGGYNENESYYEDYDLLLRLTSRHPMYYTEEDGTAYRYIISGLSSTQRRNDGAQFRVPQKIRFRYMGRLNKGQRVKAFILWCLEDIRLEIRILGRSCKRIFTEKGKSK